MNTHRQRFAQQLFNMLYQANLENNDLPDSAASQQHFYGDIYNALMNLGYRTELEWAMDSGEYDLLFIQECIAEEYMAAIKDKKAALKEALKEVDTIIDMIQDRIINTNYPEIDLRYVSDFLCDKGIDDDKYYQFQDNSLMDFIVVRKLIINDFKTIRG